MSAAPEIAIVEANTLACLGLKGILEEIIPIATIRMFHSFSELVDDTPDMYVHYFVSASIYMEHNAFFLLRKQKTIVLAGSAPQFRLADVPVLDVFEGEKELVRHLLILNRHAHRDGYPLEGVGKMPVKRQERLSAREIEVLVLIVRGFINKEIAEKLHIGLTTVISHRKNITEKLGIKSVSALTIYAVMNGYVEVDRL